MALLGFTLPPDSGEKLTLGIWLVNCTMFALLYCMGAAYNTGYARSRRAVSYLVQATQKYITNTRTY